MLLLLLLLLVHQHHVVLLLVLLLVPVLNDQEELLLWSFRLASQRLKDTDTETLLHHACNCFSAVTRTRECKQPCGTRPLQAICTGVLHDPVLCLQPE
jgi:hypothetical protein